MNKRTAWLAAAALVLSAIPGAALAKPPHAGHDEDRVTICHVTASEKNPYVVITVDWSAFDGVGKNDHTLHVHESPDGVMRMDVMAQDGMCPSAEPTGDPTGGGGGGDGGDAGDGGDGGDNGDYGG